MPDQPHKCFEHVVGSRSLGLLSVGVIDGWVTCNLDNQTAFLGYRSGFTDRRYVDDCDIGSDGT